MVTVDDILSYHDNIQVVVDTVPSDSRPHHQGMLLGSQMVQWLRIRPPRQRTQVQSLIWEDPTLWGHLSLLSRACAPQ